MKIRIALIALTFLILLSACTGPIVIPANVAITLPPNQNFIISATVPPAPGSETETPGPSSTPTLSPTPSVTPTQTASLTPRPTRKPLYPVAQGTALIDMGFQAISVANAPELKVVFEVLQPSRRHAAASLDGQKLFVSTSTGLFLFNRKGEMEAHWQHIFTMDIACESCISVNRDGSRVALMTRNQGMWEAQVYDIAGQQANLFLALPVEAAFRGRSNEASIAISPDNTHLAFQAGEGTLRVLNLESKLQVLGYERPINGMRFTPDGTRFVIHAGQEMLFYDIATWNTTANLLLPREDTPYAFSPDGQLLALALPTRIRIYSVERLRLQPEINVPPANAVNREWQLAFIDNETLEGYALTWDTYRTSASVESVAWDARSGKVLRFDSFIDNRPDALVTLWHASLDLPVAPAGQIEVGTPTYNAFRFMGNDMLLVNGLHSACWLKLLSGESSCFNDPTRVMFASDGNPFTEVLEKNATILLDRSNKVVIQAGPYRIAAINRTGEWAVFDNGTGTDLYAKGKKLPQESVNGQLQGFAENNSNIVFTTLEKENTYTVTVIDKASGDAIYQKTDNFLYKPILMMPDGTIYYIQNELERNQTVLNMIDPVGLNIHEVTRFGLPAKPKSMTLSVSGLFAFGMQDGALLIMTKDGSESVTVQLASSAIEGLSFSPDGRLLAVASAEGVRVYTILPGKP